jgi:tRNA(Ile)-lysidine synthase
MPSPHTLEAKLATAWRPEAWQDVTVLLAVSGGPDSVALLRAMTTLKRGGAGRVLAAHVNHQLRAEQSDEDEAFVIDLCRQLNVPCEVHRAEIARLTALAGGGLEAAAREIRYGFLRRAATRLGARYVVTAHTADDQAETVLHRIIRGTGIAGLSGIWRARPLGPVTLIRPLLAVRRAEILRYLEDVRQPYRVDSTNRDTRLTRNRIRHELLPDLADRFNPGVVEALLRLGRLAGEAQAVLDRMVEGLQEQCVREAGPDRVRIRLGPLADQPRYVVRELLMAAWRGRDWPLQAMGFVQWDLLADMALGAEERSAAVLRKQMFPGGVLCEAGPGHLELSRRAEPEADQQTG